MLKITCGGTTYYPKYEVGDLIQTSFNDQKIYDIVIGYNVDCGELFYKIYDLETGEYEEVSYATTVNEKVA